jgi:hypothetical protein
VSAGQRGPLLPGIPPLALVHVHGQVTQAAGSRSSSNAAEVGAQGLAGVVG